LAAVSEAVAPIIASLKSKGISVKFDDSDARRPGWKFAEYELKGVPLRLAIGARDLENGTVELARRDTKTKSSEPIEGIADKIEALLAEIQIALFDKAAAFRSDHTTTVESYDDFKATLEGKGGFVLAHWDGTVATEERVKKETKATIRCIPFDNEEAGTCIFTGNPSKQRAVFARAY
jgi:prolyl-tRNA synthetase